MADTDSLLADILDGFLAALAAGLAGAGRSVPEENGLVHGKAIVTPGCETLQVYTEGIKPMPFGEGRITPGEQQATGIHHNVLVRAQLWRCAPGPTDDSPITTMALRDTSARELLRDAWAMQCEVMARLVAGTLFSAGTAMLIGRVDIGVGLIKPLGPDMMAGWQFNAEVDVPTILVAP